MVQNTFTAIICLQDALAIMPQCHKFRLLQQVWDVRESSCFIKTFRKELEEAASDLEG